MSEPEFVDVSSLPLVADERWYYGSRNGTPASNVEPLRIVSLNDFISVEEETAEPLLGTKTETLLPADGMLLMYGDGGAGKTTLTIDMACHLASGTSWLGIEVQRAVSVTLIENEGPRGKFRQVLAEKTLAWQGPGYGSHLHVLEEPWTRFTLQESAHRVGLASHITSKATDLVVMGPLATLGMIGGGTPDEINVFEGLLRETRALLKRPVAFWIVHHENKAGDVSGAWERVPDTLCHVQARGNGHTTLVWRKARWSSESHGTSVDLTWGAGRSFELVEEIERDPYAEMLEAFQKDDEWRTAKEAGKLIEVRNVEAKKILAELTRRGLMMYEKGPLGRHGSAHCWRLKGAPTTWEHLGAPSDFPPGRGAPEYSPPPFREGGTGSRSADEPQKGVPELSAPPENLEDDIPF